MQAQVKEMYFIFNFEYMYAALSRGMLHRLSIKSHAQQKSKYPSEMSETQCPHTLHTSLNQKKNWMVQFTKLDGPVWTDKLQQLVFKYQMF
jgi:ABC-type antimicrobial peptide transport system ATPase subunit